MCFIIIVGVVVVVVVVVAVVVVVGVVVVVAVVCFYHVCLLLCVHLVVFLWFCFWLVSGCRLGLVAGRVVGVFFSYFINFGWT